MNRKEFGKRGEDLAVAYLLDQGYEIIKVNYRKRSGEVDIVANDKDYLCFIEVKTRHTDEYGTPLEAITAFKQRQLIKIAKMYIADNELEDSAVRFDVVGIMVYPDSSNEINLIKDAFRA
ncbi:MAG: YraN family protein [Candidatus Omnitrophica bacterium]|nr:YraN family protein [Candidatus Omnitrophota bacterium]